MDAPRPSFLQRSRYSLTPSEPLNDDEEVTDLPRDGSDAPQPLPPTPHSDVGRHLQRLLSAPIIEEEATDLASSSSFSTARHQRSFSAASATSASSRPSSSDDEADEEGEGDGDGEDHLVDSSGRVRRYLRKPSIAINGENALQHQDILIPTSPLTPVSPVISAALASVPPPSVLQRWLGFIMLATSALCFSLMSLFVSLTGGRVNSFLLVWWRCVVQFSIAVAILLVRRVDIRGPKGVRRWIFARGAVGICSLSCFYFALTSLPLSEATVLFFTAPLWVSALGRVVLHESFDRYDALAAAASFIGVIFVARPSVLFGANADDATVDASTSARSFSIFIALLGAFISAWVYIFIRRVGKGTDPLILVHYLGLLGVIFAPFDAIAETWSMPEGNDLVYMLFLGLFAFAGQYLFNAGVQKEKAGVSSLIRNLDVSRAQHSPQPLSLHLSRAPSTYPTCHHRTQLDAHSPIDGARCLWLCVHRSSSPSSGS